MKDEFDHIVVGVGGIGSAAAYWLSRRAGGEVLGLEQFEMGHDRGASQDHSRIIRLSYHRPHYVELAGQAYAAWSEVEAESGDRLVVRTGGIDLFPAGGAIPMADYTSSMEACHVPFEILDAGETMHRWPQWRLPEHVTTVWQEAGGIVAAAAANAAHRGLAARHGATLRDRTPVTGIDASNGEVTVRAGDHSFRCGTLVIAADAWTNELLAHLGTRLPLVVTKEQVTYFAATHADDFAPERFPIWIWMDDPCFYGFPSYGEPGPKAAQDVGGPEDSPRTRTFHPDLAASRRVRAFLARHLPGAVGPEMYTKTCLYTLTPDRDFVLDRVPGSPNVVVALGAAHGFKFASLLGRIVSELALDGETASDISRFAMDREVLTMENPPTSYMV